MRKVSSQPVMLALVAVLAVTQLACSKIGVLKGQMALRDAVKSADGARSFATGLYDFLHGAGDVGKRFRRWCEVVGPIESPWRRVG